LVLPRDPNPYQRLLYGEMQRLGVEITYLGELTSWRTVNLLLLPLEMVARRAAGARLIHLHWVFAFALPGSIRGRLSRTMAYVWFLAWLRLCRVLGMHLVWTAHNVLPHRPVFADDVAARRALVKASDLVLAHSQSALVGLSALGAVARKTAVIPHGPIAPLLPAAALRIPGTGGKPRQFLFLGRVQEYKGVEDLLAAFLDIPDELGAHLTVAGQCDEPSLQARLYALARNGGERIVLRLERVPDEEVTILLAASDVVVLPFRCVTTSGSAMLALSHGRPLIVPDLASLADLPEQAVLRYGGGVQALVTALTRLAAADDDILAAMSAAARGYAFCTTWQEIAATTYDEMLAVLGRVPEPETRRRELRAL